MSVFIHLMERFTSLTSLSKQPNFCMYKVRYYQTYNRRFSYWSYGWLVFLIFTVYWILHLWKRTARLTYGLFSPPPLASLFFDISFCGHFYNWWFMVSGRSIGIGNSFKILFTYLYILRRFNNSRFLFGLKIFLSVNYPPLPIPLLFSINPSPSQFNFLALLIPICLHIICVLFPLSDKHHPPQTIPDFLISTSTKM